MQLLELLVLQRLDPGLLFQGPEARECSHTTLAVYDQPNQTTGHGQSSLMKAQNKIVPNKKGPRNGGR